MKKLLAIVATAAIVAMAGTAMAGTANLAVTAQVDAACTVTGGSLSFGNLDPSTAPAVPASTTLSVICTNGSTYNVSTNYGLNHGGASQAYLKNGAVTIPYSVSSTPSTNTGNGLSQNITINGTIAAGSYSTASAGTYTDTMVITVAP